MPEIVISWRDFEERDKRAIVLSYANALEMKRPAATALETFLKIFDLANPDIVMGSNDQGAYCRVHESSASVINLLIKNYL